MGGHKRLEEVRGKSGKVRIDQGRLGKVRRGWGMGESGKVREDQETLGERQIMFV